MLASVTAAALFLGWQSVAAIGGSSVHHLRDDHGAEDDHDYQDYVAHQRQLQGATDAPTTDLPTFSPTISPVAPGTLTPTAAPAVSTIPAPRNDECATGVTIAVLPYQASGTTVGATADFDMASCGGYEAANGVWYSYTPTATKIISVTVDNGQSVRVYSGACDDLECLAGLETSREFIGEVGIEYRFLVSTQDASAGSTFNIQVEDYLVPRNDVCTAGVTITSLPFSFSGSTVGALPDFDDNSCGAFLFANGVWFSYTSTVAQTLAASVTGDQNLRVYSGECDDLTCVEELSSDLNFEAEANVAYRLLVSKETFDVGGDFDISLQVGDTPFPTSSVTAPPTLDVSASPSAMPSASPTAVVTVGASEAPSNQLSMQPSSAPSAAPTSGAPVSFVPTPRPSDRPSPPPTTPWPSLPPTTPGPTPDPTPEPTMAEIVPGTASPSFPPPPKPTRAPADGVTTLYPTTSPIGGVETAQPVVPMPTETPSMKSSQKPGTSSPTFYYVPEDECTPSTKAAKFFKSSKSSYGSLSIKSTSASSKSHKSAKCKSVKGKAAKHSKSTKSGKSIEGKQNKYDPYRDNGMYNQFGMLRTNPNGARGLGWCSRAWTTVLVGLGVWLGA